MLIREVFILGKNKYSKELKLSIVKRYSADERLTISFVKEINTADRVMGN
jgi:hypothetical protein